VSNFSEPAKIYFGVEEVGMLDNERFQQPQTGDVWVRRSLVEDEITIPPDEDPANPRLVQQQRAFLQRLGINPDRKFTVGYIFDREIVLLRQEQ
jgi:hypothetical protein